QTPKLPALGRRCSPLHANGRISPAHHLDLRKHAVSVSAQQSSGRARPFRRLFSRFSRPGEEQGVTISMCQWLRRLETNEDIEVAIPSYALWNGSDRRDGRSSLRPLMGN